MHYIGVWQFVAWWAVICAVVARVWLIGGVQQKHLWTDRHLAWLFWHWFTGGPLETGRAPVTGPWVRARRAVLRTTVSIAAMGSVHYYDTHSTNLGDLAVHAAGGVTALVAVTLTSAWVAMRAALYMWWAKPIHQALLSTAGWDPDIRPWRWVHVPRSWENHRFGVRIRFPRTFDVRESTRDKVEAIVRTKADWGDIAVDWRLAGRYSKVIFRPASRLPEVVTWTDRDGTPNRPVRAMVTAVPAGTVWLGMGKDGTQVTYDLRRHPHVLISGATGAGKSAIARSVTAQLLAQDTRTEVVTLDSKHLSQTWLRDIPGARNLHEIEDIAAELVALAADVKARVAHVDTLTRTEIDQYIDQLARKVVIVEEAPTLMDELDAWWRASHPRSEPCPAVAALRLLLNMSRITGYHVIGIAQRADAKAMGGPQARENFVLRILPSGYTQKAWNMLVPEINYHPSREHAGWAMVCHGSQATETQMLWITDDEAEEWIHELRGNNHAPREHTNTPTTPEPSGFYAASSGERHNQGKLATAVTAAAADHHDDIELVTLREATDSGLVPMSLEALRSASLRDPDFPQPVLVPRGRGGSNSYLTSALVHWYQNRPRSPSRRQGYQPLVYFIVRGGRPRYGDVVKIGRTDNLTQRLDSFADHPNDVIKTIEVGSTDESKRLERELHERWAEQRVYPDREQFRIEGELAEYMGVRNDN